jgi:hypothetical protein
MDRTCLDVRPIQVGTGLSLSGVQEATGCISYAVGNIDCRSDDLQLRGWQSLGSLGSLVVHRIVRVAPTATTLQALLAGVSLPLSL